MFLYRFLFSSHIISLLLISCHYSSTSSTHVQISLSHTVIGSNFLHRFLVYSTNVFLLPPFNSAVYTLLRSFFQRYFPGPPSIPLCLPFSPHLIVFVLTLITDHFSRLWSPAVLVRQWLTAVFIFSLPTLHLSSIDRFPPIVDSFQTRISSSTSPRWPAPRVLLRRFSNVAPISIQIHSHPIILRQSSSHPVCLRFPLLLACPHPPPRPVLRSTFRFLPLWPPSPRRIVHPFTGQSASITSDGRVIPRVRFPVTKPDLSSAYESELSSWLEPRRVLSTATRCRCITIFLLLLLLLPPPDISLSAIIDCVSREQSEHAEI